MRCVFSAPDPALVHHVRNLLEHEGIACVVQGELRGVASGELPPIQCWPELWIVDDDRFDEAWRVASAFDDPAPPEGPHWICPTCGERLEPQFTECWLCRTPAPAAVDDPAPDPVSSPSPSRDRRPVSG